MSRDKLLSKVLWAAAGFNVVGALVFAFPASSLGRLAGLPGDAPSAYRAFTAFFILLFGAAYAWLARQPQPDRPMVVFGALGKGAAFALIVLLWLAGAASGMGVALGAGDLLFAGLFLWCVRGGRAMATSRRAGGHARVF